MKKPNLEARPRRLSQVNNILAAAGFEERLVIGNGYLYFVDGKAMEWFTSSVPVCRLGHMTLARWIATYEEMSGNKVIAIEELKPCPFCGGKCEMESEHHGSASGINPSDTRAHYGRCVSCGALGPWMKSKTSAARFWNMRN